MEYLEMWWVKVAALLGAALVAYWILMSFVKKLKKRAKGTENLFDDALFEAIEAPLSYGVLLISLAWIISILDAEFHFELFQNRDSILYIAVTVLISWFVLRIIRIRENQILAGLVKTRADETTITAIFKILRLSVTVLGALVVFQTLGFSLSGIIAFGGIGGAAVAFAAKDLLSNFFGGMMIYLDKPFSVGDWVRSPDKNIEGTIEYVGWRVTRIRTFDKRPLYVPNGVFAQIGLENPSRMTHRRIYETIGVRYADFSQVEDICLDIKRMLEEHQAIDSSQTLMVNFNRFADSSLEFFIYTFTHTTNWQEYHGIKQDILLKIGEIIQSHKAEIAFPSQSVYVESAVEINDKPPQF